jgi:hypothetical protein
LHADFPDGVGYLFADGDHIYVGSGDALYRVTRD